MRALHLGVVVVVVLLAACSAVPQPVANTTATSSPAASITTTVSSSSIATTSTTAATCTVPSAPSATPDTTTVFVYFACAAAVPGTAPQPLARNVPASNDPPTLLRVTLEALLAGPTAAEAAAGFTSPFSVQTTGILNNVVVDDQGLATINFTDFSTRSPSALSDRDKGALVWALHNTVFQFNSINRIIYEFDGSCDAFGVFLNSYARRPDMCGPSTRADWQPEQSASKPVPDEAETNTPKATLSAETCVPSADVPAPPGMMIISIYVYCSIGDTNGLFPLPRSLPRLIPATGDPQATLRGTMAALMAGTTEDERRAGFSSWFYTDTAGMLNNVTLDAAGVATINFADFSGIMNNASTSGGSGGLLTQLGATVFQFPEVNAVIYQFNDSCEAFYNWLQRSCQVTTRAEWIEWQQQRAAQK